MDGKTAILVVSFGSSHEDTIEKTISAIENKIKNTFPGNKLYRAFTSNIIIKIWASRGVEVLNSAQALEKIIEDGYTKIIVQPTHIINGNEYEKMLKQILPYTCKLDIKVGQPLLTDVDDYKTVADTIINEMKPLNKGEALVLMGHGTEHYSNSSYAQMEYILKDKIENVFLGTVEGYPELDEVIKKVKMHPEINAIRLEPFMIVAGDHAKNDMAGDGEDSWESIFEAQGYKTTCNLKGLGEYKGIQELFAQHVKEAKIEEIVLINSK